MPNIFFDLDFEIILLCALRYALPRTSYAVDIVAEFIEKNWANLSSEAKSNIHEDINTFYGESYAEKEPWNRIIALKLDDKKSGTL